MEVGEILRAPLGRRAWSETVYLLASAVLTAFACCCAIVSLLVSVALAATAAGVPLLAFSVQGARKFGGLQLRMANRLLGERLTRPEPPTLAPGLLGRMQSMLSDATGWRAMAFAVLHGLLALPQVYVVAFTWGWGLVGLTYPFQHAFGQNDVPVFDAAPVQVVLAVVGALLLLATPWVVHVATLPSRLLTRWLLAPGRGEERVRHLRETRALAVDDAASTLRRVERDLHDGAQARLVALTMQLTMVREAVPAGPARELVVRAQATAHEAIAELRELVRGIHPPVLDQGLEPALASLAAATAVPVTVRVEEGPRPTAAIESIAYFCTAELLANVAKHSGADRALVEISRDGDLLRLLVGDNGRGGARIGAGSGLPGLLDRIRAVDGRLSLRSPPGGPTEVLVELPTHA